MGGPKLVGNAVRLCLAAAIFATAFAPLAHGQCSTCGPCSGGGKYGYDAAGGAAGPGATLGDDDLGLGAGIGAGDTASLASVGGYIDSAIIRTRAQFTYDNVQGGNSDRAEFLYPAYNTALFGLIGNGTLNGPTNVAIQQYGYQDLMGFAELALVDRFSVFFEAPYRWTNAAGQQLGTGQLKDAGFSDLNMGARYGLINNGYDFLTLQFKVFTPTGDPASALGVGHVSLQPGVLFQTSYDKLALFGELHDWISLSDVVFNANDPNDPLNGRHFSGNVLRYGVGAAYAVWQDCCCSRLQAVGEVVGWSVLDGLKTNIQFAGGQVSNFTVVDANGDTIVNAKFGLRYTSGPHSLYAGYGFPLTGDRWYSDIIRIQYQYNIW